MIRPALTLYTSQADYTARRWYELGATQSPWPFYYRASHEDGQPLAYLAGVIARAFGVDLSATLLST